jgi:hypothetical protein
MAKYHKVNIPELGDVEFFPNLGALGEFEDHYQKPWYLLLGNATKKMWFVLLHKCYEVACKRKKSEVVYTVEDFALYFTKESFAEIVPLIEADLMDEMGIDLEELEKKTNPRATKKK